MKRVRRFILAVSAMVFVLIGADTAGVVATEPASASSAATPPSGCPKPPFPAGAQPTSVSGPFTPPPSSGQATITDSSGKSVNASPAVCGWKYTFGPDTVYSYYLGQYQQSVGAQQSWGVHEDGVDCNAYTDQLNYDGGAVAETQLDSSYCNTDGYTTAESNVQSDNNEGYEGPLTTVAPNFHQWYGSFAPYGDVDYADFQLCSEDPPGQYTYYSCVWWLAGPNW